MSEIQTCGIVCPTDWVPLPLDRQDDVKRWAKKTARELRERSRVAGCKVDEGALRRNLRARAEDSRSREPLYAFAFYPDGFDTALALLEVDVVRPGGTVPHISLDWLADVFGEDAFGSSQISHVDLPIGPAVRLRRNVAADGSSRRSPGVPLQRVTYGIRPTGTEDAVVLLVSWLFPDMSEEMEEAADGIVQTLTVGF